MNAKLAAILDQAGLDPAVRDALLGELVAHEDEALDLLRLNGASMGLRPAMTALVLAQVGLGTDPDPGTIFMLQGQATIEGQQMQAEWEEIQRRMGESP